jgi:hypothetical protein
VAPGVQEIAVLLGVGSGASRPSARQSITATASTAGAAAYVALGWLDQANLVVTVIPMAIIFAMRLAAIQFGIHRSTSTSEKEA